MSSKTNIITVLLALFALLAIQCGAASVGQSKTAKVDAVLDKLDEYLEHRSEKPNDEELSSKLSLAELEEAFAEIESWDVATKITLLDNDPMRELFSYVYVSLGAMGVKKENFVNNFEYYYELLHPVVSQYGIGEEHLVPTSESFDKIVDSLTIGADAAPLTEEMLKSLMAEYENYARQADAADSSGAGISLVEWIFHFFNREHVRVVHDKIFPLVHDGLSQDELENIKKVFMDEMGKVMYGFKDGQWQDNSLD